MKITRNRILVSATIMVWLAAYLAWTADRYVMPFPLDVDRTLRRFVVCCIGILYCWPLFLSLKAVNPASWKARAGIGIVFGCAASAAYAASNIVIAYIINPVSGRISFAECVQIFMGVCWVFFLWITVYYIIITEAEKRAAQQKLVEVTEAELRTRYLALTAQVHPHFLFNTLNTISGLILEGNPVRAEQVTMSLAALLRRSLDTDLQTLFPLGKEIDNVHRYLMIVKARFEDRFEIIEDVAIELHSALIPPMVLQPLIENVFQHGLSATSLKVTLTLRARRQGDLLVIQILDNAGSENKPLPKGGTGIGQTNIRQRLALLYGGDAELACSPISGGYESRLSLPWRESPHA